MLPTGTIFTFKHKGVSKAFTSGLTPEQEEQMWDRYLKMHSKNQPLCEGHKNLQFRCGLSSYMSENLTPLLKFELPKNVTAKYDTGVVSEDYVNECKTISTLNNDNDQPNMCSSAPQCRSHLNIILKTVLLKILAEFDLDKNTMRDVRRSIKANKIDWNGNK